MGVSPIARFAMAIPNRTTITCPACGASEAVIVADTSVGPQGRVSRTPVYCLRASALWTQTDRDGETWLSCTTCGAADFTTLAKAARRRGWRPGRKVGAAR